MNKYKLSTLFHFKKSIHEDNIPNFLKDNFVEKKKYSDIVFICYCLAFILSVTLFCSVLGIMYREEKITRLERSNEVLCRTDSFYNVLINDHKGRMIYKGYNAAAPEEQSKCDWILLRKK